MKKRIIIAAVFTACLALYAAVWPQAETVGETPELPQTPAVSAPEATVAEREEKIEATPPSEKEKTESLQPEPPHETTNEPEPAPVEASAASDTRPTSAPEPAPEPSQIIHYLFTNVNFYVRVSSEVDYDSVNQIIYLH